MKSNSAGFNGVTIDSFFLTFVKLITTLLGLISIKLISSEFSLTEYGTYSQALLIVSTFTSFTILGLSDATNYYYNRTYDSKYEKKKYMSTIFAIQYIVGILAALIIISNNNLLTKYFQNDALKRIYLVIAFMPLLNNLLAMLQVLYISTGKAKVIAIRNLVVSSFRLIIFAVSALIFNNINAILFFILILDIAQFFYFYAGIHSSGIRLSFVRIEKKIVLDILKYSIPVAGYIILNTLMRDLDKLTITYFMQTEDLAIYTNMSRLLPFDLFSVSMATVLLPFITVAASKQDKKRLQFIYGKYLNLNLLITMILVSGAIIFSDEMILVLYGDKYIIGKSIFIIYLFVDLVRFANISLIFSASGKTKLLLYNAIVTLLANLCLNLLFYSIFGMVGPAIATLIVILFSNGFFLYNSSKLLGKSAFKLFELRKILVLVIQIVIFGICFHSLNQWIIAFGVNHYIRILFGYGFFCILNLFINKKIIIQYLKDINGIRR